MSPFFVVYFQSHLFTIFIIHLLFEHEDSESIFLRAMFEFPFIIGVSDCTSLDLVEWKRLRNRCRLEVVGGRYKWGVYVVVYVDPHDDFVIIYLRQKQTYSRQQVDSQENNQLRQWLTTSEERLSTNEE